MTIIHFAPDRCISHASGYSTTAGAILWFYSVSRGILLPPSASTTKTATATAAMGFPDGIPHDGQTMACPATYTTSPVWNNVGG